MKRILAAALLFLGTAAAQDLPSTDVPSTDLPSADLPSANVPSAEAPGAPPVSDWTDEVVVVHAAAQGPAMWRLKQGESEIWLLGTVGLMPKDTAWNTARLDQAIAGANAVYLPPEASTDLLDFFDLSWFLLTHRGALSMPDDRKLEASLSPDLRARFVALRQGLGKKADRYEDDSPLLAGFRLLGDFVKAHDLVRELPEKAAKKIARRHRVKVRRIADYDAVPVVKEMLKLPPAAGRVCFANAVNDVETLNGHAVQAADAWAVGDVAAIKANYSISLFRSCVGQARKFGALNRRAVDDTMKTIHKALQKPGKAVLLVNIGWLFRSGGVADHLAAEGLVLEEATSN